MSPARLSESAHLLDHCIQEIKSKIQRLNVTNVESPSSPAVECKMLFFGDLF